LDSSQRLSRIIALGRSMFVGDLERAGTVAAGFIGTEAAHIDGVPYCDLRDERDRLPALSAFFLFKQRFG